MAANAYKYGFIMSYPLGSVDKTCYGYEPWHFRYVGRTTAKKNFGSTNRGSGA